MLLNETQAFEMMRASLLEMSRMELREAIERGDFPEELAQELYRLEIEAERKASET